MVGIAYTRLHPTEMPADAVDRANRAPYLAKTSDRNRVAGMVAAGMPEIVARCGDRGSVVKAASFA
jgi:hypothetical protein